MEYWIIIPKLQAEAKTGEDPAIKDEQLIIGWWWAIQPVPLKNGDYGLPENLLDAAGELLLSHNRSSVALDLYKRYKDFIRQDVKTIEFIVNDK